MKDRVEIGHLTKYDAFRTNRDQVMDLEIQFKIHTNISNFEKVSCTFYLKEDEMKIAMFAHFKERHGNHKIF